MQMIEIIVAAIAVAIGIGFSVVYQDIRLAASAFGLALLLIVVAAATGAIRAARR